MLSMGMALTGTVRSAALLPFRLNSSVTLVQTCLARNIHTRRRQQCQRTHRTLTPRDRRIDQIWTWMAEERREKKRLKKAALLAQNQTLLSRWFSRSLD
ncbi:hypothetical protein DER46DRAFT_592669 [Fusarium sp. MPI-SDFR-AT-0072]|nr:hypothetical protein DER46DRAFT_592669 [Fusarium sp. MPI-SDFR-AT-0072]